MTILRKLNAGCTSLSDDLKRKFHFNRSVKRGLERISDRYDIIHFFNMTRMVDVDKPSFVTINSYVSFCPKGNLS
ncbi:MAG: hypothetical protein R6U17_05520 [Thermoplasmata archaeon]